MKSEVRSPKSEVRSFLVFVLCTCFGLWSLVFGLPHNANAIITASLDKAVSDIGSTYAAIDDLTANFSQKTRVLVLDKDVSNSGTFSWKKPGMFFIDYSGEKPKQYISNNKKIWVYVPGDTQVEVYKVSPKTVSKEALEFMRGFTNITKLYKIVGWKKSGSSTDLTLVPTFDGAPYSQLKCHFRGDNLLDEVTIYNVTGNISTYKFSNIRINTGLSDDLFRFNKPSGVKEVSTN